MKPTADEHNQKAVHWYEQNARYYDSLIDARPPAEREDALRRLVAATPAGASVLEIGSGNGRDAGFVESLGVHVQRSDATDAFIALQAERGSVVQKLNVLTDALGGPWGAVLAMCVLQHIPREATDRVLAKISDALLPGGVFLASVREDGDDRATAWSRDAFAERLARAGLAVIWDDRDDDGDRWFVFLAGKPIV